MAYGRVAGRGGIGSHPWTWLYRVRTDIRYVERAVWLIMGIDVLASSVLAWATVLW